MSRRKWAGFGLILLAVVFSDVLWTVSVETARTIRHPSCNGAMALSGLCDTSDRVITGIHMVGVMTALFGGLALVALGVAILATQRHRHDPSDCKCSHAAWLHYDYPTGCASCSCVRYTKAAR